MRQRILIVDDSDFTAVYLEGLIGEKYRIEHAVDGESGVSAAIKNPPSVVLMDVDMPGMDGYEACRLIKQSPVTSEIPVIFLSARSEASDRLAGYEAGGDDYINKPFEPDELSVKIERLLLRQNKSRELHQQVQMATNTAMTAMSSAGDSGIIMRFLAEMVGCLDLDSVARCVMRSMDNFGLDTSLQLRSDGEILSYSRDSVCSPLEESVLCNMALCARIVDVGSRSAFNYPCVTIIVKSMPRDNPDHYGRIKDNLAIVAESVDVHLRSLTRVNAALKRGDNLLQMLQHNMSTLRDIETRYRTQRAASSLILNKLIAEIEDSFVTLGLTEDQERRLQDTVRSTIEEAQSLYNQEIEADSIMRNLSQDFDTALQQEIHNVIAAPAQASPKPETSFELF